MPIGVMVGLTVGGIVTGAVGQVKAGNAAKRVGEFNAAAAEARAEDALARGAAEEGRFRQGIKGVIGSQRAGFAAQGVAVDAGSPLDVQGDTAFLGELDALMIRENAAREAWGHRTDAQNARLGGQQAQTASRYGAAATVLGGAGSLMLTRYGWNNRTTAPAPRPS